MTRIVTNCVFRIERTFNYISKCTSSNWSRSSTTSNYFSSTICDRPTKCCSKTIIYNYYCFFKRVQTPIFGRSCLIRPAGVAKSMTLVELIKITGNASLVLIRNQVETLELYYFSKRSRPSPEIWFFSTIGRGAISRGEPLPWQMPRSALRPDRTDTGCRTRTPEACSGRTGIFARC